MLKIYNKHDTTLDLQDDTSIFNSHHSIPEPKLFSSNNFFNAWFGIPYKDEFRITHIRALQPSKILTLNQLHPLIPQYPSILFVSILRQLVLHILPSYLAKQLSTIISSKYQTHSTSHRHNKYIIYCFHLQPMASSLTWKGAYIADKETLLTLYHYIYHQSFERNDLSSLPAQYRSTVVNNVLSIVAYRLF